MTRKLPISLAVASLLFALPRATFAQTPTPVPAPPPPGGSTQEPPPPPPAPAPAGSYSYSSPPVTPPSPPPPPSAGGTAVEFTSLRILRDKGIITQAEYESAMRDLAETSGSRAGSEGTAVMGKWSTTIYGFAEADYILDTTRSFNDLAGASLVGRSGTQAGDNGRMQFGVRNSRLGLRMRAPETNGVRASAQFEMDFQGTTLPIANPEPGIKPVSPAGTESAFFTSPVLRVRHLNLKIETPVVDFLMGQYWTLFGWGSLYQPNTVEIQGVPGEIYARTPQLRISKTLKADPVFVEMAVAATRPVQRDSETPDGQAGIRFGVDSWTGVQTVGSTGTQISPLSVGVSGLLRHVAVDEFSAAPKHTKDLGMSAIAVDGFLPVLPGTKDNKNNALSLHGEFATGYGLADMYTNLTGGVSFPALPNPMMLATPPSYAADIDNGIVTYDSKGNLHGIQWTTFLLGLQYYLPGVDGKVFVSGNYSHISSANTHYYGSPAALLAGEDWFDANLFFEPVAGARIGLEYANFNDRYVDGQKAINHRGQLSGFFIF